MAKKVVKKKKSTGGSKSGGRIVTVDFGDTESRGGKKSERGTHVPPGDYAVKVVKTQLGKSSEKESPGIFVTYQITAPKKYKGKKLVDRLWLTKKALWRVRQTWEACGVKVPSKKVKLDPKKIIGKTCAVSVDDDEYEGKIRSNIVDTFLLSDYEEIQADEDDLEEDEDEGEDEEDEEGEDEDEEEDDEEDEEDDEGEEEEDDLEDVDLDSI
jgi:hypothetical protein